MPLCTPMQQMQQNGGTALCLEQEGEPSVKRVGRSTGVALKTSAAPFSQEDATRTPHSCWHRVLLVVFVCSPLLCSLHSADVAGVQPQPPCCHTVEKSQWHNACFNSGNLRPWQSPPGPAVASPLSLQDYSRFPSGMSSVPHCLICPHCRHCQSLSAPQGPSFYLLAYLQWQMGHGNCRVLRSSHTITALWRTSWYNSRVNSFLAPRAGSVSVSSGDTADGTGWWL